MNVEKVNRDFAWAIVALKEGMHVRRAVWKSDCMFLFLVPECDTEYQGVGTWQTQEDYISMKTMEETFIPWIPSYRDMLAEDWQLVELSQSDERSDMASNTETPVDANFKVRGDETPLPYRGTETGLNKDRYDADLSRDATNRIKGISEKTQSDTKEA